MMNISEMSNLEKSKAAAELNPDWTVEDMGQQGIVVYGPGRQRLFVMTEANNFFETRAAGAPGLYQWAWPLINRAVTAGMEFSLVDLEKPLADFVPPLVDEILEAANVEPT